MIGFARAWRFYHVWIYLLLGFTAGALGTLFINKAGDRQAGYVLIACLGLLTFGPVVHRLARRAFDLAEPGILFAVYYFVHISLGATHNLIFGSPILILILSDVNG